MRKQYELHKEWLAIPWLERPRNGSDVEAILRENSVNDIERIARLEAENGSTTNLLKIAEQRLRSNASVIDQYRTERDEARKQRDEALEALNIACADAWPSRSQQAPATIHEHRMISVDSGSYEKLCWCGYREGGV